MSCQLYSIALSLLPGLGASSARKLSEFFGNAQRVFEQTRDDLLSVPGIQMALVEQIVRGDVLEKARKEVERAREQGIRVYDIQSPDYPWRLRECEDAPLVLFSMGNAGLDAERVIAVVGTRSATEYGKRMCRELLRGLTDLGIRPLVVSGLAYGIDICAHRTALELGLENIAVLAHGLDQIYPSHHSRDARSIAGQGALLSEFVLGTPPLPYRFVQRNRIIAGLCDVTVVVESASKGGALITAGIADSYHRDVLAYPGRSLDRYSGGCNILIATQRAQLVQSARDVVEYLGWTAPMAPDSESVPAAFVQGALFDALTDQERSVLHWITKHQSANIDELCTALSMPVPVLTAALLSLELSGLVRCLPGKTYICE